MNTAKKVGGWTLTIGLTLTMTATAGLAVPFVVTAAQAAVPAAPTFTKDIAPILQRSCENCHRAGGVAAMSLST